MVTIRTFDIALYEEVLALWKRCEGIGLSDADSREAIKTYLQRNPAMSYVAMAHDSVVGTVLAGHDGRRGYIHHLAVDAGWRRQGIARRLAAACLGALSDTGIQKAHVFIFTDNEDGMTFWKAEGWIDRHDLRIMSRDM